jgi:outer membrane receptor protein involved in Fe transport
MHRILIAFGVASALGGLALAQDSTMTPADPVAPPPVPKVEDTIQVTATRVPEAVLDVPASVTVVTGEELAARGAHDLASALSQAAGVAVAPGGDGGPASSVPELMGLREFDAFLLVVDGVPWGGAFNPALSTLDLTNVDRIEILRGAAPVLFGATSFVGVIHVIHRAPDATPREARVWGGSYGSAGATASTALGGSGSFHHSLVAGFDRLGLADDHAGFDRAHVRWDGAGAAGKGQLRLSLDFTSVRQDPTSPHPRQGPSLTELVPLDANHNPADARIDEDRYHFVAGYQHDLGDGEGGRQWVTTVAFTGTERSSVRGFLREEFDTPADESNADGFRQDFDGTDYYIDTHLAWQRSAELSVVAGVDVLGGKGKAESENFEYHVALDGSNRPQSGAFHIDERPEFEDERTFAGLYTQVLWRPASRWAVDAGLRLNDTSETQKGDVKIFVEGEEGEESASDQRDDTKVSGSFGASFMAWQDGADALWLFADYKDAFKPAAVDFGPEAEGEILKPETARTLEAGIKGSQRDGRLVWQASAFQMDFDNLVISRTVDGRPSLDNGGQQRFEGAELEGRWRSGDGLTVEGSYAWHSAKFRDFVQEFDGVPTQLAGHRLEMSPDSLAALAVTWAPERGWRAWASGAYVGERFLNKRNSAVAGDYNTLAAGVGYAFEHGEVRLEGDNLTDERPPISESELGESSYYRLPARSVVASVTWRFQ